MAPIKKQPMPKKPKPTPPANRMFAGGPGGLVKPKKPKSPSIMVEDQRKLREAEMRKKLREVRNLERMRKIKKKMK